MTANSVVNQIFQSESFVLQKGLNCPKSTIQGGWYTRWPFPVQTPRLKAVGTPDGLSLYQIHGSRRLVHQTAFSCTNSTIQGVGTPDGLFLYQIHDSMQLVHQTAFSCTKSTIQCSWYTGKPFPVPNPRFNAVGTPESLFLYQLQSSN